MTALDAALVRPKLSAPRNWSRFCVVGVVPMLTEKDLGVPVMARVTVPMLTPSRSMEYRAAGPGVDAEKVTVEPESEALCSTGTAGAAGPTVARTGRLRSPLFGCTSTATWLPSVRPVTVVDVPLTSARTVPSMRTAYETAPGTAAQLTDTDPLAAVTVTPASARSAAANADGTCSLPAPSSGPSRCCCPHRPAAPPAPAGA